jgi:protein disulfide-isomerase A1
MSLRFVACLFVAALALVSADFEKEGEVLVLTDANIDEAIKTYEFILIEFYAPWCGHCKRLAPEYEKAAKTLSGLGQSIALAKVDATEEKESGTRFGVRGYPTLKWFANGVESEYNGGRSANEIVQWIKKKTGPPCKPLADKAAVESFKDGSDVVVVGFFAEGSDEFKQYENAARSSEDTEFGIVFDASVAKAFDTTVPSVILFKKFDEGKVVFADKFTAENIGSFVSGNALPLINEFSHESASKIFGSGIETHFLYFNDKSADSHEAHLAALREVAVDFKGKTLFVFVPHTEDRVMSYFDFTAGDLPKAILVSLTGGDMKKFGFDKEINAANIRAHVESFHSGALKPTLKSEEAPADNSGPVKVVVGTTFADIVLDTTKDVLLEFYAPWCGHCKALTPTYDELGEKFASQESIVIAKVDATANDIDHPKVNVRGFPTIIFFPANAKDAPITYEGERDLDSFVSFIETHATTLGGSGHKHDHDHDHHHHHHDHVDL